MKKPIHAVLLLALCASFFSTGPTLAAQSDALEFPAASPPALVREQVGLTTVEINYARPSSRGRTVFGGLVPYGEVWRTGANSATRISFSTDVSFGGEPVAAGTYALFTIPGKDQWTFILNAATEQWGSYGYDASQDVLRVTVRAHVLKKPVETMLISVENMRDGAADLTLAWAKARVRVPIVVDVVALLVPKIEAAMSAPGEAKPYLSAAMFYYDHDLDLDKALEWISEGLAQQPQAVWILYRKGLILAKRGDTEKARDTANQAISMAEAMGGELGAEYRRLSESLLASLD